MGYKDLNNNLFKGVWPARIEVGMQSIILTTVSSILAKHIVGTNMERR